MRKSIKLDEKIIKFPEAVGLVVRIQERKMTLKDLKMEASDGLISLLRDRLHWIVVRADNDQIEITDEARHHIVEYHAMIVLENIKKRMIGDEKKGMNRNDLESKVPKDVVDFLNEKELMVFEKTGQKFPDDQIVLATEKGKNELIRYFNKEE